MNQLKEVVFYIHHNWELTKLAKELETVKIKVTICKKNSFLPEELRQLADSLCRNSTELLVLSDIAVLCKEMAKRNVPVLALQNTEQNENCAAENFWGIRYVTQTINDINVIYLDKIFRRYKGLPWDILETKRCLLREITVEDVPRVAEIYQAPSVKKYMEPLYEPLEREVAYTEDYIKNVYGFYEYGTWVIIHKETGTIIGRAGLENYGQGENLENESTKNESTKNESTKNESTKNESTKNESTENESTKNVNLKNENREYKNLGNESTKNESTKNGNSENSNSEEIDQNEQIELGYVIEDGWQHQGYAYEVCCAILEYARKELGISLVCARIEKDNRASAALCRKLGFVQKDSGNSKENSNSNSDMLLFYYEM